MGDYTYRNKNTGQVATYPNENRRLSYLQNWETLVKDGETTEAGHKYEGPEGEFGQFNEPRSARGNLLGSSNIGDRQEERHQVPEGTFEPKVEFTDPSKTQLPGQHPDPEDFHPEKQPDVITVDPSQQVQPKTGEGKRELRPVVLDENMDMNPAAKPLGAGADDGVLSRAHPELEGAEERRQELIKEQQDAHANREVGDPEAGHPEVLGRPHSGDDASTDGGAHNDVKQTTSPEVKAEIDPANRPAKTATKDRWVDWAVECGADRAEAKDMTKADLIDIYGE